MDTIKAKTLPIGFITQIGDPNSGEVVTVRITESGWKEQLRSLYHLKWYDMFEAEVIEGFNPGRTVRGYLNISKHYDQETDEECEDIYAFLLADSDIDETARDLRLAREGRLTADPSVNQILLAGLERVMSLRDQLQQRGWSADYLRSQLRPENGSLDLRFIEGTGWLNGHEVVHDGHLVKTPEAPSWVQGHSVVRHRGYSQVYVTAKASVERVDEFLRDALWESHPGFRENVRQDEVEVVSGPHEERYQR